MCDGASGFLTGNADKIIAASSMISAVGNLAEGKQTQNLYNYKAAQADADAEYERGMGQVNAGKIRKAGSLQQSEVRAAYGGSGIDVGSGSSLVTAETLQRNISEDATAQLLTGIRRGAVLNAEARGSRAAGENARTASSLAAGRSILSGTAAQLDAQSKQDKWIRKSQQEFAAQKTAEWKAGGGYVDAEM